MIFPSKKLIGQNNLQDIGPYLESHRKKKAEPFLTLPRHGRVENAQTNASGI